MSSTEALWLNVWETIGTIGFILVIIGVVIEGVEHFKKFPKKEHSRKIQIEKIGWFIVVIGLAMEFLGDHKAKRIADAENARLNLEAGDARKEAGEAIKQAGLANERASANEVSAKKLETQLAETKVKLANAEARLNESVANLEEENQPFDIGDQATFANTLKPLKGIDVVFASLSDLRSQRTVKYLKFAFAMAGWTTIREKILNDFFVDGVIVGCNGDAASSNAADVLRKLMVSRGLPTSLMLPEFNGKFIGDVPTNAVVVVVSRKPSAAVTRYMVFNAKRLEIVNELGSTPDEKRRSELLLKLGEMDTERESLRTLAFPESSNREPGLHLHNNTFGP